MPPWPGSSVPLSFTPAPRLIADSARSPTCPAMLLQRQPRGYRQGCAFDRQRQIDHAEGDAGDNRCDRAFPAFPRAHGRRQFVPSEVLPDIVRTRVADQLMARPNISQLGLMSCSRIPVFTRRRCRRSEHKRRGACESPRVIFRRECQAHGRQRAQQDEQNGSCCGAARIRSPPRIPAARSSR